MPERIERLRDPEIRLKMLELSQSPEAGVFRRLADFGDYRLGDVYRPRTSRCAAGSCARSPRSASSRTSARCSTSSSPTSCARCCGRSRRTTTAASWDLRREVWNDPRAMIGGSDAGAHLDRMCGAPVHDALPRRLPPRPPADLARARGAAHHQRSRRRCSGCATAACCARARSPTSCCSIPETIGSDDAMLVADLPGDSARLTAGSQGIDARAGRRRRGGRGRSGNRRDAGSGAALRARHRHRHRPLSPASSRGAEGEPRPRRGGQRDERRDPVAGACTRVVRERGAVRGRGGSTAPRRTPNR